jgi:uncharacterized protein YigE (DUF2233 family)
VIGLRAHSLHRMNHTKGEPPTVKSGAVRRCLHQITRLIIAVPFLFAGSVRAVDCKVQAFETVQFTTWRVDVRRESLHLYWRDAAGKPYRNLPALRDSLAKLGKTLTFAMNAGMYMEDLSPLGLFVQDHRELVPLNRRTGFGNFYRPPNGVFLIDEHGARVLTTQEYADVSLHLLLATQSDPMLVHRGAITQSPVMNSKSTSLRIRNGVCVPSPEVAVFVISDSPVTFYAFAKFFPDQAGCREELYLDGSISSLYAPSVKREDAGRDLGPMFGVSE